MRSRQHSLRGAAQALCTAHATRLIASCLTPNALFSIDNGGPLEDGAGTRVKANSTLLHQIQKTLARWRID